METRQLTMTMAELQEGKKRVQKERDYLLDRNKPVDNDKEARAKAFYKIPQRGDPVCVSGMSRRPELNGACAQVLSKGADNEGFLVVRVQKGGQDGSRKLKVRAKCLTPMLDSGRLMTPLSDSASLPELNGARGLSGKHSTVSSATSLRSGASASCRSYHSSKSGRSGGSSMGGNWRDLVCPARRFEIAKMIPEEHGDGKWTADAPAPDYEAKFHPVALDDRIDLRPPYSSDLHGWHNVIKAPPIR